MVATNLVLATLATLAAATPANPTCGDETCRARNGAPSLASTGALGDEDSRRVGLSKVIGTFAWGRNGERLGIVDDVLIDGQGRTVAIVLRFGWFLGVATRSVAVPIRFVRFETRWDGRRNAPSPGLGETATHPRETDAASVFDDLMAGGESKSFLRGDMSEHVQIELTRRQLMDGPPFDGK